MSVGPARVLDTSRSGNEEEAGRGNRKETREEEDGRSLGC